MQDRHRLNGTELRHPSRTAATARIGRFPPARKRSSSELVLTDYFPAARTIGAHLSTSARTSLASASGGRPAASGMSLPISRKATPDICVIERRYDCGVELGQDW